MSDSKSLDAGSIPATPIRFTRDYQRIVEKTHPEAMSTPNPHCYVWNKPSEAVIRDLLIDQFPQSSWDYLEYFSPNPIPGSGLHIGHEVNLLIGYGLSSLLGLPGHSWINDLGLNCCKGLYGKLKGIPYDQVNLEDPMCKAAVQDLRAALFQRGYSHPSTVHLSKIRDAATAEAQSLARALVPLRSELLYESDHRARMKELIAECERDQHGRASYHGTLVGTSKGLPLYACSDIVYREYLKGRYHRPLLLVGKDQEQYHRDLNRHNPVSLKTNPCIKTEGRKVSKRRGDRVTLEGVIEGYRSEPCGAGCAYRHALPPETLRLIVMLNLLFAMDRPVMTPSDLLPCATVGYWQRILAPILSMQESDILDTELPQIVQRYPDFARLWSHLPAVVAKTQRDLNPGFLLKFLEVVTQANDHLEASVLRSAFHRRMVRRTLRVLLSTLTP